MDAHPPRGSSSPPLPATPDRRAAETTGTRSTAPLAALLAVATLLRLALGWIFFGFLSGDDVEILEAAFRGIGLQYSAWAIRNNLLADVVVRPFVTAAHALGAASPRVLIWVASWPFVALATLNIVLLHRLARAWSPRRGFALTAAALYAFHWLPLGFGSMTYPRTVSTTFVLAAALLLSPAVRAARRSSARAEEILPPAAPGARSPAGRGADDRLPGRGWSEVAAGVAMAMAFTVRYSEAIYLPAVALLLLAPAGASWRTRITGLVRLAAGFGGGALLLAGVYEAVTEGRPFGSLVALLRFTVVEHQTSSVTALHPFAWYLWRLPHWWCPAALPFAAMALFRRCLSWAWGFVLIPLLALSLIQFKELRYLQGMIPFVCLLSAAGALVMWDAGWRRTAALLCAASMIWGLARLNFLAHKSMPAVLAARALAADEAAGRPGVAAVAAAAADPRVETTSAHRPIFAAAQLWAYGDRLYLGDRWVLRDIPYPGTSAADLDRLAGGASAVALYAEDLGRQPELEAALRRRGLCSWRRFRWHDAKTVTVFRPCRS
jgi:hypothetical protein